MNKIKSVFKHIFIIFIDSRERRNTEGKGYYSKRKQKKLNKLLNGELYYCKKISPPIRCQLLKGCVLKYGTNGTKISRVE